MKKDTQLQIIVKESGLEKAKADVMLKKFQDYFKIAGEWEIKAKTIHVTDESQTANMQMARIGRLFLRDKRIEIENTRKSLKEQSLREGKAIDGIANVLKALIIPVEEYLGKQEHFVEIRAKEAEEKKRIEIECRMEEERIAREKAEEKAEAEERERSRVDNERLKKEALEKEEQLKRERAAAEKKQRATEEKARKEREAQEKILAKERAENEAAEKIAKKEREKQYKIIADQKAKAEKERLGAEEKALKIKAENEAKHEALQAKLDAEIECPYCHKKFIPEKKGS